MNREKIKRIARDLSTMTMPEALHIVGSIINDHGDTVANAIVNMLYTSVSNPGDALSTVQGALWLMDVTKGNKIPVIKVIRNHSSLGLKEAKLLSEAFPVAMTADALDSKLSPHKKAAFARDLQNAGARVEFRP